MAAIYNDTSDIARLRRIVHCAATTSIDVPLQVHSTHSFWLTA